jgi:hypothetical protein
LTLVALGYMHFDGSRFSLRPRVLELGFAYLSSLTLPEVAEPHMEALVGRINESSSLSVLDDTDIVYVARVPTRRIMSITLAVGTRLPAYATSMGRVLLAALPDAELEERLARIEVRPLTKRTVKDRDALRRTLDVVRESALPPDRVLVDHLNETTVKEAKDSGCWLGFSVYPDTKMDEERMIEILRAYGPEQVLVNSAADWGRSDPLKTRKVGDLMLAEGFTEDDVDRVLWRNPVAFYGLSGRLNLDVTAPGATHEGNSILRGGE